MSSVGPSTFFNFTFYLKLKYVLKYQVSKREKTIELLGLQPRGFKCFLTFGNLMKPEARAFSKETIHNYAVLYYSHFSLNDLLYSVGIHFLWAFVFNYPIVSRCTKFVFQKRCELEVICILLLPWPKEAFVSRKVSRKKNLRGEGSTEVYQI